MNERLTYDILKAPLNPGHEPSLEDKLPMCVALTDDTVYACFYNLHDWSPLRQRSIESLRQLVRVMVITRVEAARLLGIENPVFDSGLEPVIEAMESRAEDD